MTNKQKEFDLGVIGAGPAGYNAAQKASGKGLSTVLFNKDRLGGVCLNEGCIPVKTLLFTARLFEYMKQPAKYGLITEKAGYDLERIMKRKEKIVKKLVGGVRAGLKKNGVEIIPEAAVIRGRKNGLFRISAGNDDFLVRNILIATGSLPSMPPVKGIEETNIMTSREILDIREIPGSLAIIGGGVVGMEFAGFFSSMGTRVTVLEMLDEVLPGFDPDISKMLREVFVSKGVDFKCGARVEKITGEGIVFRRDGEEHTLQTGRILISTGRKPVVEGIGLDSLGIEYSGKGIKTDSRCCTNVPGVYAAGDVNGFSMLAHTAYREGEVAINCISGDRDRMRYEAVPQVVYTHPEAARVGLTQQEAAKKGIPVEVINIPLGYSGRFVAENEGFTGLAKLVTGKKNGEVLGMHMIGNPASEIIYGPGIMIEHEMLTRDIRDFIFPHPTVSEIIREAAHMGKI